MFFTNSGKLVSAKTATSNSSRNISVVQNKIQQAIIENKIGIQQNPEINIKNFNNQQMQMDIKMQPEVLQMQSQILQRNIQQQLMLQLQMKNRVNHLDARIKQEFLQKYIQKQLYKQIQEQLMQQKLQQKFIRPSMRSSFRFRFKFTLKLKPKIKIPTPDLDYKRRMNITKKILGSKLAPSYEIYIGSGKKVKRLGGRYTPSEAISKGAYVIDRTKERTVRIVPTKQKANSKFKMNYLAQAGRKFRNYRIQHGKAVRFSSTRLIEKRKFFNDFRNEIPKRRRH
jgi:hypothetical protein